MLKNSKVVLFLSPLKVGQAGNFWTLLSKVGPLPPKPVPLKPQLAGNMLHATQCYVCRTNFYNEKTSFNPFHSKAKTER